MVTRALAATSAANTNDMADTQRDIAEYQSDHDVLIELRTEMRAVRTDINDWKQNYVTKVEFLPIKILVYGFVGLTMVSFVGALLFIVFHH
jgi:hypothetical protein